MLDAFNFDGHDATSLAQFFNVTSGSGQPAIVSDTGRSSTKALSCNSFGYASKTFPATSTPVVKFGWKAQSLATAQTLVTLLDSGTAQVSLRFNTDGTLQFQRGGTNIGTASAFAVLAGAWYHVEVEASIADSGGTLDVYVNGDPTAKLSFSGDTKNTSAATANSFRLGPVTGEGSNLQYFKDVVWNTDGVTHGDLRAIFELPTGDEGTNDLTPSTGSSHYAVVDESTPSASDTLAGETGVELFSFAAMSVHPATIVAVIVETVAYKDDAGARSIAGVAKRGGTEYSSTAEALSTSTLVQHHVFETDPSTSAAWTEANVNAGTFGFEVT